MKNGLAMPPCSSILLPELPMIEYRIKEDVVNSPQV
jgi:hypothetical protein